MEDHGHMEQGWAMEQITSRAELQSKGHEDQTHTLQDKDTCEGHPNIGRRLPEGYIQSQQTTDRQ